MVRVYRASGDGTGGNAFWSFSYTDWHGAVQVAEGTESRLETARLAERVQQEHNLIRKNMRRRSGSPSSLLPSEVVGEAVANDGTGGIEFESMSDSGRFHLAGQEEPEPGEGTGAVPVGERLIQSSLITRAQLEEGLERQESGGGKIIDNLIVLGHLTGEQVLQFMGKHAGVPAISLANCGEIPREVLELISAEMASSLEVIPIDRMRNMLSVAMVCPLDDETVKRLEEHTGLKVRRILCSREEFRSALHRHYASADDGGGPPAAQLASPDNEGLA